MGLDSILVKTSERKITFYLLISFDIIALKAANVL